MEPIPCVYFEPTKLIRRWLRRFRFGTCPQGGGNCCNAMVFLDDIEPVLTADGCIPVQSHTLGDPRWPLRCEGCGYVFSEDQKDRSDQPWQVACDWIYRSTETGEMCALREMPVGAIWRQAFGHGPHSVHLLRRLGLSTDLAGRKLGEVDGVRPPHLFCRTPGGVWDMDTTAKNGDGWEVSGTPPLLTASPSIWHDADKGGWHGWLRNGILTQA